MNPTFDWALAHGQPVVTGHIRGAPADFIVDEQLTVDFSNHGEHDWLRVEKTNANTHWVAERLANHANVRLRDVGYAGLKDRHAVVTQWFSVRRRIKEPTNWDAFDLDGVRILERHVHARKLQRGAHRANSFRIAVRGDALPELHDQIAERLAAIGRAGVPNYFGEQRFGRNAANVELGRAALDGKRLPRHKRSIGLSAMRSLEFNNELSRRVADATWNRILPGDTVNLDGTGSLFKAEIVDAVLSKRCDELDIHPCGYLPALEVAGVDASPRPLRTRVHDLNWEIDDSALCLEFSLDRGSYATAVLRELILYEDESGQLPQVEQR